MKVIKKLIMICLLSSLLCLIFTTQVMATESDDIALHSLAGNKVSVNVSTDFKVSYGLDVIAHQNQMTVAGLKGNALNFSASRFACALNLSEVESITITKLPSEMCGNLYIGSDSVSLNQKIKANDISLMTYEESKYTGTKQASFEFRINDSTYDVVCNIAMIDKLNYSPTVSVASNLSLNNETYKNIKVSGVMAGYDPEGDKIKYEIVKYPQNGRVILEDDELGTYTYVPNSSFVGEDRFSYVVYDIYGNYSASADVKVCVMAQSTSTVYSDLLDDDSYSHAISMTERGLMNGVKVGGCFYFEPDREVSRAEFVVTAMNALGIKNVPDVKNTAFADDEDISPEMKGYISLAYSKGYISGIKSDGDIYFIPDEKIKLAEAAVIISNMIGYADSDLAPVFSDSDEIPTWSYSAIKSLYTLGILEFPDNVVGANDILTKGDFAKILNKTLQISGR